MWALAGESSDPGSSSGLDVGAGTGRNALALARRGHPVDAVEMSPKFADIIRAEAERESLPVRVMDGDVFETMDGVRRDYQLIILPRSSPTSGRPASCAASSNSPPIAWLRADGLVFNTFLARAGLHPRQRGAANSGNSATR